MYSKIESQSHLFEHLKYKRVLGMCMAKKIVSRYITIRDQRIAIHTMKCITRFNLSVKMVHSHFYANFHASVTLLFFFRFS